MLLGVRASYRQIGGMIHERVDALKQDLPGTHHPGRTLFFSLGDRRVLDDVAARHKRVALCPGVTRNG